MGWSIVIVLLGIALWGAWVYNKLVRARNLVANGFADIDVQLQRRHDLVPQLVGATRAYASFERDLLEQVTALRQRAQQVHDPGRLRAMNGAESALAAGLGRLLLLAESYPDLKASENFRQLSEQLVETENRLSQARRFYNGAVRELNTRIQQIPDALIAVLFGFREALFFRSEIETRTNPEIAALWAGRSAST